MQELESEFKNLLLRYAERFGITKEDVDGELVDITKEEINEELAEAQRRMESLRKKKRHDSRKGKVLQRQITDFERLAELGDRMGLEALV